MRFALSSLRSRRCCEEGEEKMKLNGTDGHIWRQSL